MNKQNNELKKQNNGLNKQNNLQIYENFTNKPNKIPKSQLLAEDERVILENLDKKWKWIARDENGCLCVYDKKPKKGKYELWLVTNDYERMNVLKKGIFKFIKWEDDKPYNIEELLKGECGNE